MTSAKTDLDYVFNPRSIAVVGVSSDSSRVYLGTGYVKALIDAGYGGKIFTVGLSGGEIFGLPIHRDIMEIPGEIDYVITTIPAGSTLQLVRDCARKGVKVIHIFSSGYSEIADPAGKKLQSELLETARRANIRIIGPNCMGVYCPSAGLSFALEHPEQESFPRQSGPLGFIAQSGVYTSVFVKDAASRHAYCSKVVSYGNAVDLNESHFIEYMADDPATRIIGAYIEGIRDGDQFARVLKRAAGSKPVIIFKAGTTEAGRRAAASHTSSLAGSNKIWESLLKQSGAIQVYSVEEIVDVALLLLRCPPAKGRNIAIVGLGGGASVQSADEFSNAGFRVPALSPGIRKKMTDIFGNEVGRIFANPIDANVGDPHKFPQTIKVLSEWEEVDSLVVHLAFDGWSLGNRKIATSAFLEGMLNMGYHIPKPLVIALHSHSTVQSSRLALEVQDKLSQAGFPVYPSLGRAAAALARFSQYHTRLPMR